MPLYVRERVLRLTIRRFAGRGGSFGSVTKLADSVLRQDTADAALRCTGMSARAWNGEQSPWVAELLEARSATIYGGASETQRNIIGGRVGSRGRADSLDPGTAELTCVKSVVHSIAPTPLHPGSSVAALVRS